MGVFNSGESVADAGTAAEREGKVDIGEFSGICWLSGMVDWRRGCLADVSRTPGLEIPRGLGPADTSSVGGRPSGDCSRWSGEC